MVASISRRCTYAIAVTLVALALSPVIAFAKIWYRGDINYTEPRKELAREATELWHKTTSSPLQYVGGSQRYEDAVAFYSPDHPHVFIHLDYHRAPWVTRRRSKTSGALGGLFRRRTNNVSTLRRTSPHRRLVGPT